MKIQRYVSKIKYALDGKNSAVNNGILYALGLDSAVLFGYVASEAQRSNFDEPLMDGIKMGGALLITGALFYFTGYTKKLEKQATEHGRSIDNLVE